MPCFIWAVCNKLTIVWAPTKNCSLADSFLDPKTLTKYGSGWRKDVVNQCLEFETYPVSRLDSNDLGFIWGPGSFITQESALTASLFFSFLFFLFFFSLFFSFLPPLTSPKRQNDQYFETSHSMEEEEEVFVWWYPTVHRFIDPQSSGAVWKSSGCPGLPSLIHIRLLWT